MGGILLVGAFGASLIGIGLLEGAGVKINHGMLTFTMEAVKFGGLIYLVKMAATLFL
ncbi:hypothetical protein [Bacillus sp. 1P06AnD]|uniref:hypothetical protein n=1 Tax=Bacillus sp. 1P06AnD TaxID=3132208 RepID=UPI0039A3917B